MPDNSGRHWKAAVGLAAENLDQRESFGGNPAHETCKFSDYNELQNRLVLLRRLAYAH